MPKKKKPKALRKLERDIVKQEELSEPEIEETEREATEPKEETEEGLGIEKEEREEGGLPVPSEEESLEEVEEEEE